MSTITSDADAVRRAIKETLPNPSSHQILPYTPTKATHDPILLACFSLIEETSSAAYAASSKGWRPKAKQREMREEGMHYLLLLPKTTPAQTEPQSQSLAVEPVELAKQLLGFISFMLTIDDGVPVIYIYEIHLCDSVRGQGMGKTLMDCVDAIGKDRGMRKAMLTVFVSNVAAIGFYEGLGYEKWDEEYIPPRKRLRSTRKSADSAEETRKPSYIIMAKDLDVNFNMSPSQDKRKTQSDTPDSDGWETDD